MTMTMTTTTTTTTRIDDDDDEGMNARTRDGIPFASSSRVVVSRRVVVVVARVLVDAGRRLERKDLDKDSRAFARARRTDASR